MLLPNLYKVNSNSRNTEDGLYEFIVEINPLDPLFPGHFPQRPILPGVCSIQIVRECLCGSLGIDMHFMNISQCKFTGMVDPNIDNLLEISVSIKGAAENGLLVNATIKNSNQIVFKMKATLTEVKSYE